MKLRTLISLLISHSAVGVAGFSLGIYVLPILIAPASPTDSELGAVKSEVLYKAQFKRDLQDSDMLHWGEGEVVIGSQSVAFMGELAPGPDYKLYLSPQFVETEADFNRLKPQMQRVGDIKTFNNFIVELPAGIEPERYTSLIVWCETFGQFITAGKFR